MGRKWGFGLEVRFGKANIVYRRIPSLGCVSELGAGEEPRRLWQHGPQFLAWYSSESGKNQSEGLHLWLK